MRPKTRQFTFSVSETLFGEFSGMAEASGITMAECLRRAMQDFMDEYEKKKFGYRGTTLARHSLTKKSIAGQIAEATQHLSDLSCEELRAHLISIGYFPAGGEELNSFGNVMVHDIREKDGGKCYVQITTYPNRPELKQNENTIFTFKELIADLKKEGKL